MASNEKPQVLWAIPVVLALILFLVLGGQDLKPNVESETKTTSSGSGQVEQISPSAICIQTFVFEVGPGHEVVFDGNVVMADVSGRSSFRSHMSSGTTFSRTTDGALAFHHPTGGKVAVCVGSSRNVNLLSPAAQAVWEEAVYGNEI